MCKLLIAFTFDRKLLLSIQVKLNRDYLTDTLTTKLFEPLSTSPGNRAVNE